MFQFRRFPTYAYLIQRRLTEYCSAGFPHSEISGSTVICTSPKLIAACHVLHRLLMPRHSPCALYSLTSSRQTSYPSLPRWRESSAIPLPLLSSPNPLALGFGSAVFVSRSGSQAFELCRLRVLRNCFVLPFSKSSTNHFCFPLLLALHTWLLCSVFKVRFQLLSKPDPNTQSFECLHPISHYLTGTRHRRDAGSPAHKRFGQAKTLPQGQFICPEDVLSPLGLPI